MAQSPPVPQADAAPPLREPSVLQAVNFLRDPRVRSAPLIRAVDFLRAKNITEAELREAFKRLQLPYPDGSNPWQYYAPAPQPPRRSTASMLFSTLTTLGMVMGAGYTLRELIRRYVIPACFPELQDTAAIQRQSDVLLKRQEQQIEELRQTMNQLRATAVSTEEKVERLSVTVSTQSQIAERRSQETLDLRNVIRMLSQTGSIANTPGSNVNGSERERALPKVTPAAKEGNLAYGAGAVQVEESRVLPTPDTERTSTPMMTAPNTERKVPTVIAPAEVPEIDDDDDFMNMAPAQVEKHWSAASDKVSSNTASLNNITSQADTDGDSSRRDELLATTRRLFEESLRTNENTENKTDSGTAADTNSARRSTQSAPEPEIPLSDDDE